MVHRWPTLLPIPKSTGTLRSNPEDFQVKEIPAYVPSGQGSHLMLEVEKRNLTTPAVIQALSAHLVIQPSQIGYAGLKDKWALTRQWFSVPSTCAESLKTFDHPNAAVLRSGLHGNKLKTNHLKGNRFRLVIREVSTKNVDDILDRSQLLLKYGVPNYFGPQRFGKGGRNESEGIALLQRKRPKPERRTLRLLLNAVQSALFNDILAKRIQNQWFQLARRGDVMTKADTGGLFLCDDPEREQLRMDNFQIHPTGPMFGPKMKKAQGEVADLENEILNQAGLNQESWRKFPKLTRGSRRPLRMIPEKFEAARCSHGIELSFTLPPGGYATAVLRELVKIEDVK